jgi:hypothetical protein
LIAFGVPESDSTVAATSSLLSVIKDFISMLNSSTFAYDSLQ